MYQTCKKRFNDAFPRLRQSNDQQTSIEETMDRRQISLVTKTPLVSSISNDSGKTLYGELRTKIHISVRDKLRYRITRTSKERKQPFGKKY